MHARVTSRMGFASSETRALLPCVVRQLARQQTVEFGCSAAHALLQLGVCRSKLIRRG